MISHEFRCIFVHIPKTAGNSINCVFGVDWQDHKDLARYAAEQPRDVFERYFKFAIVRNPWDRLFSDYNYQRKKSRARDSKLFLFNEQGRRRNFAAWVDAALGESTLYAPQHWGGDVSPNIHRWSPQVDWITIEGKPAVDFVARLENLTDDFPQICDRLRVPAARLPHRNRRLHWHYSHYYDRTTREIVAAYYAQDITAFGYDFEDRTFRTRVMLIVPRWPVRNCETEAREADAPESATDYREQRRAGVTFSQQHAPPRAIRRLTAAVTVGLIALVGWSGLGLLNATEEYSPEPEQPAVVHARGSLTSSGPSFASSPRWRWLRRFRE